MTEQLWIQIVIWVIGVAIFIANNAYKFGQLKADFATKAESKAMEEAQTKALKDKVYERDEKIKGIYHALDAHRADCKIDYVRKDMCGNMHEYTKEEVERVKQEHKDYRHDMAATVGKIFMTLDALKEGQNELKELILKK